MVLTNALLLGLILLLACTSTCISEVQIRSFPSQETTTTSVENKKTETQNVTSTIQKLSTTTSKPKTDVISNKPIEQKRIRGSTKYADYAYSTITPSKAITTTKQNFEDGRNTRQTTVRNDRSLTINTDKYNSPEFHSENIIFSETQNADKRYKNVDKEQLTTPKPWAHVNFADFSVDLTTPKNEIFDAKYRDTQDDITKSLDLLHVLTTAKNYIGDKYKQADDYASKSVELTTPKNDVLHNQFQKIRDDISKSIGSSVDTFFGESKSNDETENIEKPQLNESKLDFMRFRHIEAIESKYKNKVRKDFNKESGSQMRVASDYNNSQIIDAPGVVVNTIPNQKDIETVKKADLDEGETRLEKISIEKPEKDPNIFISNKIEGEFLNLISTEGPEEKPFEHKNIYLSKRGSTIQNAEQAIQKTLATESGIPSILYPSKTSPSDLESVLFNNNVTVTSKSTKKDKVSSRTMKKELEISQSDLDNKIPKFLPITTSQYKLVETTSAKDVLRAANRNDYIASSTDMDINSAIALTDVIPFSRELYSTTSLDIETESVDTTEESTSFDTSDQYFTTEFFEITDSVATSYTNTEDTTTYTELSTEYKTKFTETTPEEQSESVGTTQINITTENSDDIITGDITEKSTEQQKTTTIIMSIISKDSNVMYDNNNSNNQNTNGIMDIYGYTNDSPDTNVNIDNINILNRTTEDFSTVTTGHDLNSLTKIDTNDTKIIDNTDTIVKKNETIPSVINEITKPANVTAAEAYDFSSTKPISTQQEGVTENVIHSDDIATKENVTNKITSTQQSKQNEINSNGEKVVAEECENLEDGDDYGENNCKNHNTEEGTDGEVEFEDNNSGHGQNNFNEGSRKSTIVSAVPAVAPTTDKIPTTTADIIFSTINYINSRTITTSTAATTITFAPPVSPNIRQIEIDTEPDAESTTKNDSIVGSEEEEEDGGNGGRVAAIVISTIGGVCLLLLVTLLIIMKKRQKRFNYGQRCRPVSLDAYSMDNVSIHNSTRRKGVLMTSKRSYGNPAFEDPTSPSHQLNFAELLKFTNNEEGIKNEFEKIPQVTTKTNELPEGCDVKNRYANVIPLPETRVFLSPIDGVPSSDYINANYVTGPQGAINYYIACQAPMQNTIEDFWRMVWEQQSKAILMLTHLYENGVEKCIDYLPPSEVLDCHRLFGDYQITLKKREVKDKYIISNLQLKNMISNSWREITHLWYMGWPEKGVPEEANSLIAFLIEARSCIKMGENKIKETNNTNISNGLNLNLNPVVVHCSPGTGRTGTLIACDIAVREFELTRKVNIPRIVYRVRRDRASAVQTKEQYVFIYKVINFYATKLTGGMFDSF